MKTILASTYAVNPYKGSEDGTGWNFILQIARFNRVIAITRLNNRKDIEKYLSTHQVAHAENIHFEYYDLPYWMRFWKKGSRGALIYYYMWQVGLPGFIKKRKMEFDIVHNLNFHNDWTPSFLYRFKKPFVWGPVGHHPRIPNEFIYPVYGARASAIDQFKWISKKLFWNLDPFLRLTKIKADRILAVNSEVKQVLHIASEKLISMPAVATNDMKINNINDGDFNVLSIGRFIPLKGFDISIAGFAHFIQQLPPEQRKKCRLTLLGTGPELPVLYLLIKHYRLTDHVEVHDWIPRERMIDFYAVSKVFLFPSHEGAGMVVPEALSCGLPVICLDNPGPGEMIDSECGIKVGYKRYHDTVIEVGNALMKMYIDPLFYAKLSLGARRQFEKEFQWDIKGDMLNKIYNEIS